MTSMPPFRPAFRFGFLTAAGSKEKQTCYRQRHRECRHPLTDNPVQWLSLSDRLLSTQQRKRTGVGEGSLDCATGQASVQGRRQGLGGAGAGGEGKKAAEKLRQPSPAYNGLEDTFWDTTPGRRQRPSEAARMPASCAAWKGENKFMTGNCLVPGLIQGKSQDSTENNNAICSEPWAQIKTNAKEHCHKVFQCRIMAIIGGEK